MSKSQVAIIIGSKSDEKYLEETVKILKRLDISYVVKVSSAHRSPQLLEKIIDELEETKIIIAAAGYAAHLAGFIASRVIKPIIGVPLPTSELTGIDSLLSTLQMPKGVPVATMAIGETGMANAAWLASQILAISDPNLREKIKDIRKETADKILSLSQAMEKKWSQ